MGRRVQPSIAIFGSDPVRSPKLRRFHAAQHAIGNPALTISNMKEGKAERRRPARANRQAWTSTATAPTANSGRLLTFTRHTAANDKPVHKPSLALGASARNHRTNKINAAPKHNGDSTSFCIE